MGGKRELRRCVSLMEDNRQTVADELLAHKLQPINSQHVNRCVPITIQIDACDDDDDQRTPERHDDGSNPSPSVKDVAPGGSPLHTFLTAATPGAPPSNYHPSSPNFLDVPENPELSDLSALKATAVRLKLRTRTSSFLEWQSNWLDRTRSPPQFPVQVKPEEVDRSEERLTSERKERINGALDWLKTELKEMRSMDQHLARQLLSLRHDIHQLRLRRSCQQHRDLLDDVQSEMEEQEELSDVLDLPNAATLNDTPLKQIGVTRMNISARRFSTC